ncbi:MAG: type I-F CRISPR-associated protein Csy1 [Moraxellaceae bacterium]|nr:type I-F CRISPR-associated protein Csy1 [Moraxellaceae bacterium]
MVIDKKIAQSAVKNFLQSQIDKNADKDRKNIEKTQIALDKAIKDNNEKQIEKCTVKIEEVKNKYKIDVWLNLAVNKMVNELRFGTHISKGVHSSSRGDSINFLPKFDLEKGVVGHQSFSSDNLDASGNAASLPLASFYDFQVDEHHKIKDLILQDNADFIASLHTDKIKAQSYHQSFKCSLLNKIEIPVSDELNKQTLWANNAYSANNLEELDYTTIIPLYPPVLTFEIYQKINKLRYSEENKLARDNRYKKTVEQQPYISIPNLLTFHLGGTKPQGVGQLNNSQGGNHYLLPSLPPPSISKNNDKNEGFRPSKFAKSIFAKPLKYQCQKDLKYIFEVVEDTRNIVEVRDKRKKALDVILQTIFSLAENMRTSLPAGWSKDYQLNMAEKYWLDPMRADLEGEEEFAQVREQGEWIKEIINDFASWLNALLKEEFPQHKNDIADEEFIEWEREIEDMKKQYQRVGKGVFL